MAPADLAPDLFANDRLSVFDQEMVELTLCLPGWQAEVLEAAARRRGQTSAQVIRGLIREYFNRLD